ARRRHGCRARDAARDRHRVLPGLADRPALISCQGRLAAVRVDQGTDRRPRAGCAEPALADPGFEGCCRQGGPDRDQGLDRQALRQLVRERRFPALVKASPPPDRQRRTPPQIARTTAIVRRIVLALFAPTVGGLRLIDTVGVRAIPYAAHHSG